MRLAGVLVFLLATACEDPQSGVYARRITVPGDLIGGPGAIGAVGDYLIGNHKFRVIIQDKGWSRGFGIFGGGIIDADLVRAGGEGHDEFGELFPALLLQAFDVSDQVVVDAQGKRAEYAGIEVLDDGSGGGEARIITRATGGDFLTMIGLLLDSALPDSGLRFETEYVVTPGTRHLKIIGRLHNDGVLPVTLPDADVISLLDKFGIANLQLPLGDVTLFGVGNEIFAPGAVMRVGPLPAGCAAPCPKPVGFDLRFAMEAAYKLPILATPPPGEPIEFLVPGLVVDFLATAGGPEVSYGFAAGESDNNYVWAHRDNYEVNNEVKVSKHSMLAPFIVSSFTGVYYDLPPAVLNPGESYEYTRYFIVGAGDVASIRDELYAIRRAEIEAALSDLMEQFDQTREEVLAQHPELVPPAVYRLRGRVLDNQTGNPVRDAWVHILDERGRPFSQARVDHDGWFLMKLEHGRYATRVTAAGRHPHPAQADLQFFDMTGDRMLHIEIPPAAEIVVRVADSRGKALPAKVSLLARYETAFDGADPMDFLFDMSLSEGRRSTDLSWRVPPGERTRRYVEKNFYTYNGLAHAAVKPSCLGSRCRDYDVVVSRGPEYTVATIPGVRLSAGELREVSAVLRRVVDTSHWVSADLHVHAIGSADSDVPNDLRVITAAGEGLEIPVATDHNFVTDYRPAIAALGLYDWVGTITGVELSTLEMGHFNGFPLTLDIGAPSHFPFVDACARADKVNRTSFDWVECTPQELFDGLRRLGRFGPDNTIVQVNHPRDTILGYFNQYSLNPFMATPELPPGGDLFVPQDRVAGQFRPESFSYDFDAIEVFNGKRLDQVHAFRLPAGAPQEAYDAVRSCPDGHPLNDRGQVLYDKYGMVAYPGGVDDWMRLLNAGFTYTATGNSDSHGHASDEMGIPRTYLFVEPFDDGSPRDSSPGAVGDLDVVNALKAHRAIVSNGPFLNMSVLTGSTGGTTVEWPIGSTVAYATDARGGSVRVFFHLKTAPWITVDKIVLYANGKVVDEIGVPDIDDFPVTRTYPNTSFLAVYPNGFDRDMWLAAEAVGSQSMFPVVTPKEEPPTNISQALSALAEGLGISNLGTGDGITAPDYVQTVRPYALTNPIWLNIDASRDAAGRPTWNAPGNEPGPAPAPPCPQTSSLSRTRVLPRLFDRPQGGAHYQRADIRKIFHAQCNH